MSDTPVLELPVLVEIANNPIMQKWEVIIRVGNIASAEIAQTVAEHLWSWMQSEPGATIANIPTPH